MRLKWFVVRIKLGAGAGVVRRKVTVERLFSTADSSADRSRSSAQLLIFPNRIFIQESIQLL